MSILRIPHVFNSHISLVLPPLHRYSGFMNRSCRGFPAIPVRLIPVLAVLAAAVLMAGCSPRKESRTVRDTLRIVSLSPAATSILHDLSLTESLVGIDRWSAPLQGVPDGLAVFDMINPDAERVMALEPDIIFVSSMTRDATGRDPFKPFSERGMAVHYIPVSDSLDAIRRDVRFIAEACGVPESGESLVGAMDATLRRISRIVATIPEDKRKRVYFEIGAGSKLYSFGSGVYLDELVCAAGGKNIFAGEYGWIAVHAEQILARDPEIILTNVPDAGAVAEILSRPGWDALKAVRERHVYAIDHGASSQPAPSVIRALEEIARILHPDVFTGEEK